MDAPAPSQPERNTSTPSFLQFTVPTEVGIELATYTMVSEDGQRVSNSLRAKINLLPAFRFFQGLQDFVAVQREGKIEVRLPYDRTSFADNCLRLWNEVQKVVQGRDLGKRLERLNAEARAINATVILGEYNTDGEIANDIFWDYIGGQIKEQAQNDRELNAQVAGLFDLTDLLQFYRKLGWADLPPIDQPEAMQNYLATLEYRLPALAREKFALENAQRGWVWEKKTFIGGLRERLFPKEQPIAAIGPTAAHIEDAPRTDLLDGTEWGTDSKGVAVKTDFRKLDSHTLIEAPTGGGKTYAAFGLTDAAIEQGLTVIAVSHDRRWSRLLPTYDSVVFYNEIDPKAALGKRFALVFVDRGFPDIDRRVFRSLTNHILSLPETELKSLVIIIEEASLYDTQGLMELIAEVRKYGAVVILLTQRAQQIKPTARGQCNITFLGRITEAYFDNIAKIYGQEIARQLIGIGKAMKKHDFMALGPEIQIPFIFRVTRQIKLGPELTDADLRRLAWTVQPKPSVVQSESPADITNRAEPYLKIIREEFKGRLPSTNALVQAAKQRKAQGVAIESSWPYVQEVIDWLKDTGALVDGPEGGSRWILKEVADGSH